MNRGVDLNVDLGESDRAAPSPAEEQLLGVASSVNLSCGLHAGNPCLLRALLRLAARRGVGVGAHPSYDDRAGFGRAETGLPAAAIEPLVAQQLDALQALAAGTGATVGYVKAHGALYHRTARDPAAAAALVAAVSNNRMPLGILGPAGSVLAARCAAAGVPFAAEGFLDRGYRADGTLVPRGQPGALLDDPAAAVARALAFARGEPIAAVDGTPLAVPARSLCVHGDGAAALPVLAAVRAALAAAGIPLVPAFA